MKRNAALSIVLLVAAAASGTATAAGPESTDVAYPDRPGEREFILDTISLIDDADADTIRQMCDSLLTDKAVPIIVVTVRGLSDYNAHGSIESYAADLFNEWGIGYQEWNHGILLLVSFRDRKARIELGLDYEGEKDDVAEMIMEKMIIPHFKKGDYSLGIVEGVRGLDAMARDLEIPAPKRPLWHYLAWIGFVLLAVFTGVSLHRRGSSGWAWMFWAGMFVALFFVLRAATAARSSGGGGFGGGSFGGGSSGGGGATGSW